MEIKPHEDNAKVVITVENKQEDALAIDGYPGNFEEVLIDGVHLNFEQRDKSYPFDVVITRRSLGYIASKAMVSKTVTGIELARQILEYFEAEAGIEEPMHE